MQFTCDRQALYQAVTYVSKGVAQKSTIPALEGIRMQLCPGQLQLTGYDLEFGIQTNLPVDTHDTGEFVIHARLFSEALRRFSGNTVLLKLTADWQSPCTAKQPSFISLQCPQRTIRLCQSWKWKMD